MISPNDLEAGAPVVPPDTGGITSISTTDKLVAPYRAAMEAMAAFQQRPCKERAAAAIVALSAYGGPLPLMVLAMAVELLGGNQRTKVLVSALEVYVTGEKA